MPNISRIGDIGVGTCCHPSHDGCIGMSGVISTGASITIAEGSNISRIGDIVIGGCGHVGVIITGSGNIITEGSNTARIGDSFSGVFSGTLVTGASSVNAN